MEEFQSQFEDYGFMTYSSQLQIWYWDLYWWLDEWVQYRSFFGFFLVYWFELVYEQIECSLFNLNWFMYYLSRTMYWLYYYELCEARGKAWNIALPSFFFFKGDNIPKTAKTVPVCPRTRGSRDGFWEFYTLFHTFSSR